MDIEVEQVGGSVARVSFSVPAEEFRREVENGLRRVGQQVRLKGFRPGKVPLAVIERRHGEDVRREVREQFLRRAYQQAVEREGLKPMAHPRVDSAALEGAADGPFDLEFEISLRPSFELPDYASYTIETSVEPVSDDDVEGALEELRRSQSHPEPAGEEGAGESGLLLCDVRFLHGDEVVFEREGLRLSATTPPPGVEPEAFREALAGASDGARIEVPMTLPMTLDAEAARGEAGTCRLDVRQAFRMVPPTDAELFERLAVEDGDGLREKVRAQLGEAVERRERSRVESALIDRLIQESDFEIPAPILEEQTRMRLGQLAERLAAQGIPEEQLEGQVEEHRETAREEAEKGLRALLVVEALGQAEELTVGQDDLEEEFASIARRNGAEVDEVKRYYSEHDLGQQMAIEILERKVRTFLRERATGAATA